MSFTISKKDTPTLFQQLLAIQQFAMQFITLYIGQKSVAMRAAWGKLLESLYQGISTNTVDDNGKPLSRNKAWIAICAELGLPRSTADVYRNEYTISLKYPQTIQDAAGEAGLNLARDYVQKAYDDMVTAGQTTTPNALEAKGIVVDLKHITNPYKKPSKTLEQRLIEMFEEIYEFTSDEEVDSGFIRFCMTQATGKLTVAGAVTWEAVAHRLGQDEVIANQVNNTSQAFMQELEKAVPADVAAIVAAP